MTPLSRISDIIRQGERFLLLSHTNPDGDAVGSMLGMAHLLKSLGKEVILYNQSGMPSRFCWLQDAWQVSDTPPREEFDWAIAMDCSDRDRCGRDIQPYLPDDRTVNIDHHADNSGFGAINWVQESSSVGEMVLLLAKDLEVPPSGAMGEALYLAMVTDSGFFSYSNTGGQTLRLAGEILDQGLDLDDFNAKLQRQWSFNTIKLHGKALQSAYLAGEGRIGVVTVDRQTFRETETNWEDSEGLVDYLRRVRGVQVSLCLKEESAGRVKMSMRSWGEVDVGAIAAQLGGGGHPNAAGGLLENDLPEAEDLAIRHIFPFLSDRAHNPGQGSGPGKN